MYQMHQGKISKRKPDVVVVPFRAAKDVQEHGDLNKSPDTFAMSREKPFEGNDFQWSSNVPEAISTLPLPDTS
jgi:hypothetical protein